MAIFKNEMKLGRVALCVWSLTIAFLMMVCVLIYPEMKTQMGQISDTFAQLGAFSQAFGMDKINFGEFVGFFGVECGNVLGLGGAFFAALLGVSALSKEEQNHTAEFLLTHPVSRVKVVAYKLVAAVCQILLLNIIVALITFISIVIIGEKPDYDVIILMMAAYLIMQLETLAVCFAISAFIKGGGFGIGLGMAAVFYFLNIIANLTDSMKPLKYITPFGYTEGADIIASKALDVKYLVAGIVITVIGVIVAFVKYCRKDVAQ